MSDGFLFCLCCGSAFCVCRPVSGFDSWLRHPPEGIHGRKIHADCLIRFQTGLCGRTAGRCSRGCGGAYVSSLVTFLYCKESVAGRIIQSHFNTEWVPFWRHFRTSFGSSFESLGAEVSITWALHITNGVPTRGVPRGRAGGTIFARHDRRFIGLQWSVAALRLPEIGTGPDPRWVTPSGTRKLAPSLGCTRQDDPNPDCIPFDHRICLLTRSWYNAAILEV